MRAFLNSPFWLNCKNYTGFCPTFINTCIVNMVHLWMCEFSSEIFCCWVTRQCIFFGTFYKLLHVGSCIFWGTVDGNIGCNVGQHLVNSWPRCQSSTGWVSTDIVVKWCFPVSQQINRQSVKIASVVCQQCIGESSVEYQWGISGVSVDNWHRLQSVDISAKWCLLSVEYRPSNQSTVSRDSIGSVSSVYQWTVGRRLVRYPWCICWQLLLLSPYTLPFVTRFLTSADTQ